MTKKFVFIDLDGSLIHEQSGPEETIPIQDGLFYIAKQALDEMDRIRSTGYKIGLITGKRQRNYEKATRLIPHDFGILEHGSVIIKGAQINQDWHSQMQAVNNGSLETYLQDLQSEGYNTDSHGRHASARVFHNTADDLSENEKKEVETRGHPEGITTTRNKGFLDLIPMQAGKANAIKYIIGNNGPKKVFCIGDDINDLSMLGMGYNSMTLASGFSEAIEMVKKVDGYVSPYKFHAGTIDMLKQIK